MHKKQFVDTFRQMSMRNQGWRIWSDFVEMAAIALQNTVTFGAKHAELEQQYLKLIGAYERRDQLAFPQLLGIVVQALDANSEQDFLGTLFQELELSSHWKGQFFTPYHLCKAMAEIQVDGIEERIAENGFVTVNDPACGAGALLIAFANATRARGINYQRDVLFVAQDIDRTAAHMCYIQLALLGCPAVVIIGDTLARPGLHPENEVWYTPFYFRRSWRERPREEPQPITEPAPPDVVKVVEPAPVWDEEVVQLTLF